MKSPLSPVRPPGSRLPASDPRPSGIALILVSGLLTLLAVMAAALVQAAGLKSAAAASIAAARHASLAAESGMAYGAARLWEAPLSVADRGAAAVPANACDDWTFRLGFGEAGTLAPGRLLNPSYSHGEPWIDSGLPGDTPGAYDAGVDDLSGGRWHDKDGDGRFSAWTGRLRGDETPFDVRFSLRIASVAGLVCVNSGETGSPLDDHDMDGILNGAPDPEYAADVPSNAHRDPDYVGNVHLVNLLNNLGAVIEPPLSDTHEEWYAPEAESNPPDAARDALGLMEISHLGRRVVEGRPKGGYRSMDEVRTALAPFYSADEIDRITPFLSASGEIVPIPFQGEDYALSGDTIWRRTMAKPEVRYEFHTRIDLNTAPREIVESALRYISHSGPGGGLASITQPNTFVRILEDEAAAMTEVLAANRPIHTWQRLLAVLAANPAWQVDPLFDDDQRRYKEGLVLTQFDANWLLPDLFTWRRNCLEVPRDGGDTFTHIYYKAGLAAKGNTDPVRWGPLGGQPGTNLSNRSTTELSIAPRRFDFSVEAEGVARGAAAATRRASADFSRRERALLFTAQQDFEPVLGIGPNPLRKTWRGGDAFVDASAEPATRLRVQTRPRFPFSRFDGVARVTNFPDTSLDDASEYYYPRAVGWVGLASHQWTENDLLEAVPTLAAADISLTLPYNEDLAVDPVDNDGWTDNVWDPYAVDRGLPDPSWFDITDNAVETGILLSPDGPQIPRIGGGDYGARWIGAVFGDPLFAAGADGPTAGTIVCWVSRGAESSDVSSLEPSLEIKYNNGVARFIKLRVSAHAQRLRLWGRPDNMIATFDLTGLPPPADEFQETGWRCVALTFRRNGANLEADVYVDGARLNAIPFSWSPYNKKYPVDDDPEDDEDPPTDSTTTFLIGKTSQAGRACDVVLFKRVLTPSEIAQLAAFPLYEEEDGLYISPRLTFDTARLPDGAALTGFSWDGFIPKKTRGVVTLLASGYTSTDVKIADSPPVGWAWNGTGALSHVFPPITGCRKVDFSVKFSTYPDIIELRDADGATVGEVKIRRETPILEEFRIHYSVDRPGWTQWR